MAKVREFFFPVVMLVSWVVVAAYTLSSLGETHVRVQRAQAALHAPAVENNAAVASASVARSRDLTNPKRVSRPSHSL